MTPKHGHPPGGGPAEAAADENTNARSNGTTSHDGWAELDLLPQHQAQLAASGISPEVARERHYASVVRAKVLEAFGFSPAQRRVPCLVLPVWPPGTDLASMPPLVTIRPDDPRVVGGKALKYELPQGCRVRLDVPPRCHPLLADAAVPLWLTEGVKKADALASHGLCAAALLGVWNFLGRNETGSVTLLADFDLIAWKGRAVHIVFDSDVMVKLPVQKALARLTEHLQRKGAAVSAVYLPAGPNGEKVGVDDYLLSHSVDELQALVTAPRPAPAEPAPQIELLDDGPDVLNRPLALTGGHAYAVTWLWTRTTKRAVLNKRTGEIEALDPPHVVTERQAFVVREDGMVFGDGATPLAELGLAVRLDSEPEDRHVWRAPAVKRYRAGERPDPAAVFERIASIYDYFLDFSRSLGEQPDMCRLSACLSLMTWLAPAFTVLGYPYPNGEWGSGKTKWLSIWAETSYLGYLLTFGGTFAALRDLADWGATLAFDDAENLDDPKADPDKRALLLAGNKRGARVPLKELAPDGKRWTVRWVNAFCPRGFSAKRQPVGALAQRVIIIPLVRTADATKANRDPADTDRWPVDPRALRDDLWALALALLPEAASVWAELDGETELAGRAFEPWRAPLAVARLFERHGVAGLEATIRAVMRQALAEASEGGRLDLTGLVVRALVRLVPNDVMTSMTSMTLSGRGGDIEVETSQLCAAAREVAAELEADIDIDAITARRVGRIMGALRFKNARAAHVRKWRVPLADLAAVAATYNVTFARDDAAPLKPNVINVMNVITSSGDASTAGHGPAPNGPSGGQHVRVCVECAEPLPVDWPARYCERHGGSPARVRI